MKTQKSADIWAIAQTNPRYPRSHPQSLRNLSVAINRINALFCNGTKDERKLPQIEA